MFGRPARTERLTKRGERRDERERTSLLRPFLENAQLPAPARQRPTLRAINRARPGPVAARGGCGLVCGRNRRKTFSSSRRGERATTPKRPGPLLPLLGLAALSPRFRAVPAGTHLPARSIGPIQAARCGLHELLRDPPFFFSKKERGERERRFFLLLRPPRLPHSRDPPPAPPSSAPRPNHRSPSARFDPPRAPRRDRRERERARSRLSSSSSLERARASLAPSARDQREATSERAPLSFCLFLPPSRRPLRERRGELR
jgi:hypothetical protein